MKQLLFKILIFILILVFIFVANYTTNRLFIHRFSKKFPNVETIIVGDSHVMVGVNDKILPESVNIAQGAEPYVVTYYKLKKILSDNPGIKNVIIGFSYHNFSSFNDYKFIDKKIAYELYKRLYPLVDIGDMWSFQVAIDRKIFLQTFIRNMLLYPKIHHYDNYIGKFEKRPNKLNEANLEETIRRHYLRGAQDDDISTVSRVSLNRIVKLTNQYNLRLILLNTPVERRYYEMVPEVFLNYYAQVKNELEQQNVQIIDLGNYNLDNSSFYDYDHLSGEGAEVISKLIAKHIAEFR
jgi:hypothetical protein